jgi:hypothetical protein
MGGVGILGYRTEINEMAHVNVSAFANIQGSTSLALEWQRPSGCRLPLGMRPLANPRFDVEIAEEFAGTRDYSTGLPT